MIFRTADCSIHESRIFLRLASPMPSISFSRSDWLSSTSRVWRPKWDTILSAVTLPIPRIMPLARKRRIPSSEVGVMQVIFWALNCLPWVVS